MGWKKPGLAGGPDIKQEPSPPSQALGCGGADAQRPPAPEEGRVLLGWGRAGLTFSVMPLPHSVPMQTGDGRGP